MNVTIADILAIVIAVLTGIVSVYTIHAIQIHAYLKYKTQIADHEKFKINNQKTDNSEKQFSNLLDVFSLISCCKFFSKSLLCYDHHLRSSRDQYYIGDSVYSPHCWRVQVYRSHNSNFRRLIHIDSELIHPSNSDELNNTKERFHQIDKLILLKTKREDFILLINRVNDITCKINSFDLVNHTANSFRTDLYKSLNDYRLDIEEAILNWILSILLQRPDIPKEHTNQFHLIVAASFKVLIVISNDYSTLNDWQSVTSELLTIYNDFINICDAKFCNQRKLYNITNFQTIINKGEYFFRMKVLTSYTIKRIQIKNTIISPENKDILV